jgi:RNA polymerase sigma-70 factor (ECF subfamily)
MIFEIGGKIELLYDDIRKLAWQIMPDRVDDLTQDVVLRLWATRTRLPRRFHLSYLRKIVSNTACDILRREWKHSKWIKQYSNDEECSYKHEIENSTQCCVAETTSEYLDYGMRVQDVREALQELSPEQREVIELRADGLSFPEIAVRQAVPVGTVRTRIHHARKKLQKSIGGDNE